MITCNVQEGISPPVHYTILMKQKGLKMGIYLDLTGQKFGKLTVLSYKEVDRNSQRVWSCKCDCGNYTSVSTGALRSGNTSSCGCYNVEKFREVVTKHGMSSLPEYKAWLTMKQRCINPKNKSYPDYGGRGISVSEEWANSFEKFINDLGRRPSDKHSVERVDLNGNYEAGNCEWATRDIQNRNKRNNVTYMLDGEVKIVTDIARENNIPLETLRSRLKSGLDIKEAISRPIVTESTFNVDGKERTLSELVKDYNIPRETLRGRLRLGWDVERAVKTPIGKYDKKGDS